MNEEVTLNAREIIGNELVVQDVNEAKLIKMREDHGLPETIQEKCLAVVHIDTPMCLNVATAGSIVMYDRSVKERSR